MSPSTSRASVDVLAEHARRVARVFDARRGVDVAADVLDVLGDLPGACAARVPLKAMCSMRCDRPCSCGRSWREPAPTQTPSVARARCCGMRSVSDREAVGERA